MKFWASAAIALLLSAFTVSGAVAQATPAQRFVVLDGHWYAINAGPIEYVIPPLNSWILTTARLANCRSTSGLGQPASPSVLVYGATYAVLMLLPGSTIGWVRLDDGRIAPVVRLETARGDVRCDNPLGIDPPIAGNPDPNVVFADSLEAADYPPVPFVPLN